MRVLVLIAGGILSTTAHSSIAGDWTSWRGPNLNGIAAEGQTPPTSWSETQNIVWKASVSGRGHSSPIIVGDRVFLTTADERAQIQSVLCYNRKTGDQLWKTDVHKGGLLAEIHKKNTHASATPAWDGERLITVFANRDSIVLTAVSADGKIEWQTTAGPFRPQLFKYGYGPSPAIYKDKVIVAAEFESGGFLKAFDRTSGKEQWSASRQGLISFSSPIVGKVDGKDYLLLSGGDYVAGYDPNTGQGAWRVKGVSVATCGTLVWEDDMVFASGGYPAKETVAVRIKGNQAEAVWRNGEKCYEQSMLVSNGSLYAVNDNGFAFCWDAKTGRVRWQQRVGGPVSASLTLAGGNLYYSDERGTTYVFEANPEKYVAVGRNQLGNESFATPVIVDSQIFLRHADNRSGRQETLYCIGK
ncbi:MAG TPA: PQQ-binding-like beta-propeller repeat protein [Planctomycetaceae bacterium]|nr:PQQ-binding-like beta-propeller repeat protein [Planctomycetaceae bacterium]